MNKKAITTGGIVIIILGLLVILLIITGPLRVGYDYAKEKFFGERSIFSSLWPSSESGFQPYTGSKIQLSSEEKIVDDSVKAFICAVNSLALKQPAWLEKNGCPEGFSLPGKPKETPATPVGNAWQRLTGAATVDTCNGILYGQSCVECYNSEYGTNRIVLNNDALKAERQLVDAVIDCWRKFKTNNRENIYCYTVDMPKNAPPYWVISKESFRNTLKKSGTDGEDIAGDRILGIHYVIGTVRQNFDWRLWSNNGIVTGNPYQQKFYICADKSKSIQSLDLDEVFITTKLSDCPVNKLPKENEFKCEVKDFELPQKIGLSGDYSWAFGFINKFKDPDYVMYYESFPRGEDAAWHLDPKSAMITVVATGALINVMFAGAGTALKGATGVKNLASRGLSRVFGGRAAKIATSKGSTALISTAAKVGKELSEDTLRELTESFTKEGYERLLKSEQLFNSLVSKKVSPTLANEVREIVIKQHALNLKLGEESVLRAIKAELKDRGMIVSAGGLARGEAEAIDAAIESFVKNSLTSAERDVLLKQQATRQFFITYFLKETGEAVEREVIENLASKALSKEAFEGLSEEAAEQYVKRTLGYVDEIVDTAKPGADIVKTGSIFGALPDAAAVQVTKEFNAVSDAIVAIPDNYNALQKFLSGVSVSEVSEAVVKQGGAWNTFKGGVANYNPVIIKWKDSWFSIPRPVLLKSLLFTGLNTPVQGAKLAADTAYVTLWRPRAARYIMAYLIASSLAQSDARNEKYAFHGSNTIVLQKPYMYEKNKKYDFIDATSDYYVNLFKFKDASSRFFFASPCKTNMVITQTDCSCLIRNGEYILKNNGQPIDTSSIDIIESRGSVYEPQHVYKFDELSDENKHSLVSETFGHMKDETGKWAGFNNVVFNAIAENGDLQEIFTEWMYNYAYLPVFDYIQQNDLFNHFESKISGGNTVAEAFKSYYLSHPKDYGIFGIWFWTEPFGPFTEFNLFVEGNRGDSWNYKFRKTPLSLDEFRFEFWDGFAYGSFDASRVIKQFMIKLAFSNKIYESIGNSKYFYDPDEFQRGLWADAVREAYVNYVLVLPSRIDMTKIAKVCERTIVDKTEENFRISDNIFENGVATMRTSSECLNVVPSLDSGYSNNFCYSGDHSSIENMKYALALGAAAVDLVVAVTPLKPIAIPVAVLTGAVSAYGAEYFDQQKYWPKRGY